MEKIQETVMNQSNPYQDSNGEPVFRESLCAYLDCLGFNEMMKEGSVETLDKFREAIREGKEYLKINSLELENVAPIPIKLFTDNIVFGIPIYAEECIELVRVIGFAGTFQLSMALKGYFYRGGVSKDELYLDNDIVYGNALLKSIDIEENVSVYPRIVIEDELIKSITGVLRKNSSLSDIHRMFNNSVLSYKDKHFINYLYYARDPQTREFDLEKINRHGELIEMQLQKHINNERVRSKYLWLAEYHSFFCQYIVGGKKWKKIRVPNGFNSFTIY